MIPIKYVIGDATAPEGAGRKIITHVCNNKGEWGDGFVLALSARSPMAEFAYRQWAQTESWVPPELDDNPFGLGQIQFAPLYYPLLQLEHKDVFVCNMVAQDNSHVPAEKGWIPLDYDALRHCLRKLCAKAHSVQASIHMPRIGCGIGSGDWNIVGAIIMQEISAHNVEVTVYDLPEDSGGAKVK